MKKGFTLTEVLIALTIVGLLSLLGLNYVKRNVSNYDKLFYYSSYEALNQGFADAIANNTNLTSTSFCNYLLNVWNIDTANSSCNSVNASREANTQRAAEIKQASNAVQFMTMYKEKTPKLFSIIDRLFNKISLPVYAVGQGGGPCEGVWTGWPEGCDMQFNLDGSVSYFPRSPNHGYIIVEDNSCTPPFTYINNPSWGPGGCYYSTYCQNCAHSQYFYSQHITNCELECNPTPPPTTCNEGMHWNTTVGKCIYDGEWDPCEKCFEDDPSLYGFTEETCNTYIDGTLCEELSTEITQSLTEVGHIKTKNGIVFKFYSDLTYSTLELNVNYFAIKAELPKNSENAYFLVFPSTKELFPITPEMIDNEKLLPTYIISDYQNYKNTPITDFTTYRSARCTVVTERPPSRILIVPISHNIYSNFLSIAGLTDYPSSYCSGTKTINWIDSSAYNVPRNSVTIKTERPKGMK